MFLRIEEFPQTRLVGKKLEMNFAHDRTHELWKGFMPRRGEFVNIRQDDLYSVQVYPSHMDFQNVHQVFEKWAAISVEETQQIPDGMQSLSIPKGKYAVFLHAGPPSAAAVTFGYIFRTWLPASGFELDNRPHFEILGEKYSNISADSEEEVFIPIR